jgi:DNA polymerase-1
MQRLAPQLLAQIDAQDLGYVYRQIELPVAIPTAAMSLSGIRVNVEVLEGIRDSHEVQVEIARRRFQDIADPRINLDSSSEVADYLLDELNLPVPPRTNNAALRPLAGAHRAVPIIIAYQEHKAVRDAAQALLSHRTPDGQVYAQLDPLGTATGRFSCSRPNLLGLAAPVLQAIEASPGCLLLEADYSQMELRVLAHFSQDAALLHAFQHDEDLHRRTAARVLGIAEEAVNVEQRGLGKTLNFAIVFGMTAVGLADELGRTPQEAEELLAAYHRTYPGIAAWVAAVHEQVAATGEVRTLYGRRRYLPNISSTYDYQVAAARRQAVNTVIQGTAADLLKLALVRLNETLPEKVRMLLPVHDSVLLEVPAELEDETRRIVVEAMQAAPPGFTIPLKVDVTTGRTWAECKAR